MAEQIDITAMEPGTYGVQVNDGESTTNHRIEVTPDVVDLVASSAQQQGAELEETLVRESVRFLLEREPAAEIHDEFKLSDISRYFPDYSTEIASRVNS